MTFRLDDIVPWGRSFDEYVAMFALDDDDLSKTILGCGDGPAAFNAGMARRGAAMISVDPVYAFSADQIRSRISATYPTVVEQIRENMDTFVWDTCQSPEEIGRLRLQAMQEFLDDFPVGLRDGRYQTAELPTMPFADGEFELALCSHLLFLYADRLSVQFHLDSLRELARVSAEVRVFPLLDLDASPSAHLGPVTAVLRADGYRVRVERVPYELQKGGNEMLRVEQRADT